MSGYKNLTSISVKDGNTVYDSRNNCNAIIETASNTLIVGCVNSFIPNSVTNIGSSAFKGCIGLTSIEIPYSVTSIGYEAFSGCTGLSSIEIPNSVTTLGEAVFRGCTDLRSVIVGNGVTELPKYVFDRGHNSRLKSLTIGSGVLSIDPIAFGYYGYEGENNKPIKTIWLTNTPPTNYTWAEGTVNYVANNLYNNLSNTTVYPFLSSWFEVDGVKFVPVSPSERTCDAIDCRYDKDAENITIDETVSYKGVEMEVQRVHKYACYQNPFIKNVNISFVGDIEENAFLGCANISQTILNNYGNIGTSAFRNCSALLNAMIDNQGVIADNAFRDCSGMTTATLGDAVTSIGELAFSDCVSLERIAIPNAVTTLGAYAFYGCSAMKSVKMGIGIKTINTSTFEYCSSLTDMQIGDAVTSIGKSAFWGCSSLPTIQIPKSVTTINDNVFYGCSKLKSVIMDDNKSELKLGCSYDLWTKQCYPLFDSCPLDSVYIGRNITYPTASNKGYSPFYRNTSLRSVEITDKETEISVNEFYGCTNLKNVKIGNGVTTIGDWAFSGCSSLDYFSFGARVKTIGKEAFSDCTAMTRLISYAATPPTCGNQALDDINKWNCVLSVPDGTTSIYQQANQWKEFFFIESIPAGLQDIFLENQESATIYDLNGRKMKEPHKGFNIINGKKVMVK